MYWCDRFSPCFCHRYCMNQHKNKEKFSGFVGSYIGYGHTQQVGTIVNMDHPVKGDDYVDCRK